MGTWKIKPAKDTHTKPPVRKKQTVSDRNYIPSMLKRPGGIKNVTLGELFMFADKWDYLLMFLGMIGAMGHGVLRSCARARLHLFLVQLIRH